MMILTAKVDLKKIMIVLLAIAAGLTALILLFGGRGSTPTAALDRNDSRVKFLESFGWQVTPAPKESTQVRIPKEPGKMFRRYNMLQKSHGYDLSKYAGKKVMRYVYEVTNFPGAQEPVYATILVYKNKIIGGDVTDTSAKGKVRPFQMPAAAQTEPAPSTQPTMPLPAQENQSGAT